jgi:YD repeat-containing protein
VGSDLLGNPTIYRDKNLTWSRVRNLTSFDDVTFNYNAAGNRISKTKGNLTTKYYYNGSQLLAEKRIKYLTTIPMEIPFTMDCESYLFTWQAINFIVCNHPSTAQKMGDRKCKDTCKLILNIKINLCSI